MACGSPLKPSCIFLQAFHFLNRTAVNVLRTLAVPQALGVGVAALDVLLDDTALQSDQPSQSRLSITQICHTSEQQPCKPYEDEGLLTLIFINQPAVLQVSNSCSLSPKSAICCTACCASATQSNRPCRDPMLAEFHSKSHFPVLLAGPTIITVALDHGHMLHGPSSEFILAGPITFC